jgi:hypothetical protein
VYPNHNQLSEPKRICNNQCIKYKALKPATGSRYGSGQVRCQICAIFMTKEGATDTHRCKCCHYRIRATPRNRIYKDKIRENN